MIKLIDMITEDLNAWFGKGKSGGVGGGGWDRYNSSGDRVGKCGDADKGDTYSACLSKEKASKLGKDGRASFVKRKRAAQKKGGDAKKGGEQSKGQKPIKVKTGVSEAIVDNRIACNKCGHSWPIATGGDKPYLCHECHHNNNPMIERISALLEKNVPTDPAKWSYYKDKAKDKFDVYPSAYANAFAAKKYKAAGGGWKKGK